MTRILAVVIALLLCGMCADIVTFCTLLPAAKAHTLDPDECIVAGGFAHEWAQMRDLKIPEEKVHQSINAMLANHISTDYMTEFDEQDARRFHSIAKQIYERPERTPDMITNDIYDGCKDVFEKGKK